MIKKVLATASILGTLALSGHGAAQISLSIDGQSVVPAGQLEVIRYLPNTLELFVQSVHSDWRCSAEPVRNTPTVQPGDFKLVLDQVNPQTEQAAEYRIASPLEGGSIIQNLADGVLEIQTSSDASIQLSCAPFRESFSSSGFEVPIQPSAAPPASPFVAGSDLVVPVTIRNVSRSLVATGIQIQLESAIAGDAANIGGPTFSESVVESGSSALWTIDVLFPQEQRTINVTYAVGAQTASGTVVTTSAAAIGALNRAATAPLELGNPAPRAWEVIIGEAEGDLAASIVTVDGVAGSGSGNLALNYRITNNAAIAMTDIQASMDSVVEPAGVTFVSESASVGTVSNGVWTVPSLDSGQTAVFERLYTAAAGSTDDTQLCSGFSIDSAGENLIGTGDDSASSCATIRREVDTSGLLNVTIPSFNATSVNAGEPLRYGLSISNAGPSFASSVIASLALSVQPTGSNVAVDGAGSSSANGVFTNATATSIDFTVDGELEDSGTRSADIEIDVPVDTPDESEICLSISALSSAETEIDPNDLPAASCVTVVNTST